MRFIVFISGIYRFYLWNLPFLSHCFYLIVFISSFYLIVLSHRFYLIVLSHRFFL